MNSRIDRLLDEVKYGTINSGVLIANAYAFDALHCQNSHSRKMTPEQWRRKARARWARAIHEGIVVG